VLTSSSGVYRVPFLAPGKYDVTASATGFKTVSRQAVDVQVDSAVRVDFTLNVGTVSETVEVTASTPLLSTENAAVGTVIENKRIFELPLNGRNWLQMVALSPNVSSDMRASGYIDSRQGGERGRQPISIAGQRQYFNRFTLSTGSITQTSTTTRMSSGPRLRPWRSSKSRPG
jgi:hypothetical protein